MSRRILIADDNVELCQAWSIALRAEGYEVQHAHDAEEAVARSRDAAFDVAVIDINMPKGGGQAFCAHMSAAQPGCRIVVVTGSRPVVRSAAWRRGYPGAQTYILKPVELADLYRVCAS